MNYYPPLYDPGEYSWDEQTGNYLSAYCVPRPQYFPAPVLDPKGVRKRNPEREEDKARYSIVLRRILNKVDTRTTLMIKNIPNKYNQKLLLKKIDQHHKRRYDFFYLPIDFKVRARLPRRTTAMWDTPSSTSSVRCIS